MHAAFAKYDCYRWAQLFCSTGNPYDLSACEPEDAGAD
jgi:hypothetical protein